ncbi:MAG: AglZ/HisF2 family acetamidino modification protein [Agriterribacter sp.]
MRRIRVIPVLLLHKGGLIKSLKFKDYKYIGDPINAVKIFNEKEVDEIALVDIDATREKRGPDIKKIIAIASEAFMPMAYGGGVTNIQQVKEIFYNGIEKVIINSAAVEQPTLITQIARLFGSQSLVVSIDVKQTFLKGDKVYIKNGKKNTGISPIDFAKQMENAGAGEILLNNIQKDGTFSGYDTNLIQQIAKTVNIPVIALGGASDLKDFKAAIENGASAVAAGSMFVLQKPHRAVLISYPAQKDLINHVYSSK